MSRNGYKNAIEFDNACLSTRLYHIQHNFMIFYNNLGKITK